MSHDELLAEILQLPSEQQRALIAELMDCLPDSAPDPDMTPGLRAELEHRYQDALDHPEDEMNWEDVCIELDKRKVARRFGRGEHDCEK